MAPTRGLEAPGQPVSPYPLTAGLGVGVTGVGFGFGAGFGVGFGVGVGVGVGVVVTGVVLVVVVGGATAAQVGRVIVSVSSVTAPFRASTRPSTRDAGGDGDARQGEDRAAEGRAGAECRRSSRPARRRCTTARR